MPIAAMLITAVPTVCSVNALMTRLYQVSTNLKGSIAYSLFCFRVELANQSSEACTSNYVTCPEGGNPGFRFHGSLFGGVIVARLGLVRFSGFRISSSCFWLIQPFSRTRS